MLMLMPLLLPCLRRFIADNAGLPMPYVIAYAPVAMLICACRRVTYATMALTRC